MVSSQGYVAWWGCRRRQGQGPRLARGLRRLALDREAAARAVVRPARREHVLELHAPAAHVQRPGVRIAAVLLPVGKGPAASVVLTTEDEAAKFTQWHKILIMRWFTSSLPRLLRFRSGTLL